MPRRLIQTLDSETIISYFESPATVWLVRAAHPDRHRLSHALLESEAPDFGDASPCSHVRQLACSGNFGYARQ